MQLEARIRACIGKMAGATWLNDAPEVSSEGGVSVTVTESRDALAQGELKRDVQGDKENWDVGIKGLLPLLVRSRITDWSTSIAELSLAADNIMQCITSWSSLEG